MKDRKRRHVNAVMGEHHLGKGFVVRDRESAWIAAGVRLLHQLEVTNDVLIVERIAVELFKQIESDMRFEFEQRIANDAEVIVNADLIDFMAHFPEVGNHVPFRFERGYLLRTESFD